MKLILKNLSIFFIVLTSFSGCISQNSQTFDQLKASKTRVSLGLTYLKNDNFSQAKFNLDKALEFAPRSAEANFAMAYYYQNVGELEQAENAYQLAMDFDPKNGNIANSYGAFLCQNRDYVKAKIYFLKAVNTSNYISSAETYENLALCSRSQGKPDDSIEYLRSAVNHQPGRANSLLLLSRALIETQQWQEARVILRRYEKTSQIDPNSLLMAVKIERGLGNVSAAKDYSDMLLKIFPNDPVTKMLLAEQPLFFEITSKTAKSIVHNKAAKNISESVVSQPSANISDNKVAKPVKTDLLVNEKGAKEDLGAITQAGVADQLIAQVHKVVLEIPEFHVVVKGENLYRISLLYNIRMQRLVDWNGLVDASSIFDGKKLSLVAPSVVE